MHGEWVMCCHAGCFRNITTGVTGHVDSPNYPHKYLINSTCEWLVTAPNPHSQLLLTFEVFSMEGDTDSQYRSYINYYYYYYYTRLTALCPGVLG